MIEIQYLIKDYPDSLYPSKWGYTIDNIAPHKLAIK